MYMCASKQIFKDIVITLLNQIYHYGIYPTNVPETAGFVIHLRL